MRETARDQLWPLQVGVGVPAGAEAAVHATNQALAALQLWAGCLKLDFRNAFNSVSRQAVLTAARPHMPELAPWVNWTYGCGSRLRFGRVLHSTCGIQQGHSCSLALQPALAAASRAASLDLCFAYFDNVVRAPRCARWRIGLLQPIFL